MQRRHWLAGGLAAVVLLALAFILTGGVYRTVNAGGGNVYIVNRFTGRTRMVKDGTACPLKTEAQARREKEQRDRERADQRTRDRLKAVVEALQANDASFVGDPSTHLYHGLSRASTLSVLAGHPEPTVLACISNVASPVYLTSVLDATSKGYWPCQKCLPSPSQPVEAPSAPVRRWPNSAAPLLLHAKRGQRVRVLGAYGDYVAIATETGDTGARGVAWMPAAALGPADR